MSKKPGSSRHRQSTTVNRISKRSTPSKDRIVETTSRSLYPLAVVNDTWTRSSWIKVTDVCGTNIVSIPFDFLVSSQECNWRYVRYLIAESVEEPGELWTKESNTLVNLATDVVPGHYIYTRQGKPALDRVSRSSMGGISVHPISFADDRCSRP
jgi:hypothetical protein